MSTGKGVGPLGAWPLLWGLLAAGGGALWVLAAGGADPQRAWWALLVNFLFFTSLSGGLAVWPAVVRQCNGRWHAGVERLAAGGIAFAIPSILALVLLWAGSSHWTPWQETGHHQGMWLEGAFLLGRNLVALVLFWGLAARYLVRRYRGGDANGSWLVLVYCLVFSLLGFDLVMALDPHWYSTLAGVYFFISSLYIGVCAWALRAALQPATTGHQLRDLGRLMVAFSLMTTYMMYSHLLPIWYENLPHEVRFLVRRMNVQPWRTVGFGLLCTVYLGPLVLLLTERSKRNRWSLGGVALLVLGGMWVERWWLVMPTFDPAPRLGLAELSAAAAFAGLLALGLTLFDRRIPPRFLQGDEAE